MRRRINSESGMQLLQAKVTDLQEEVGVLRKVNMNKSKQQTNI